MLKTVYSFDIYKTKFENTKELEFLISQKNLNDFLFNDNYSYADGDIKSSHEVFGQRKSNISVHENKKFENIINFIKHHTKIYWNHLNYFKDIEPKIFRSWLNISKNDGHIHPHKHKMKSLLTSVFYLKSKKGFGNLVLQNPMEPMLHFCPTTYNFLHNIEVETGDLVILPSYVEHQTSKSHSDEERIVLVVDFEK
jgi:hypothetical protein